MHYNSYSKEYFFQLPKNYVLRRLSRDVICGSLFILCLSLFIYKDLQIAFISISIVLVVNYFVYLFGTSYSYITLSEMCMKGVNLVGISNQIGWNELIKVDIDYKWSFRGQTMDAILITGENKKCIFIPKVIANSEEFKSTVTKLAPEHPLINYI